MKLTESGKKDRFFAFKKNGEIIEYSTLDDAYESEENEFLIVDLLKGISVSNAYYEWRLSHYKFFDPNNKEIKLNFNKWTLENLEHLSRDSNILDFTATISDPNKVIRIIKLQFLKSKKHNDLNAHDCESVRMARDTLKEYSVFTGWAHVDVLNENKKLKAEISILIKRNVELTKS